MLPENIQIDDLPDIETKYNMSKNIEELIAEREYNIVQSIPKTKIKTTTKRIITLGKTKNGEVSVLIQNTQTRKNLINMQK